MAKLRLIVAFILVLFSASLVLAQSDSEKQKKTNLGLGLEFKFFGIHNSLDQSPNNLKVNNIPVGLRRVPSHPDDTWIYGSKQVIRTIPFDSLSLSGPVGITFSLSPELTVWRFRLRSGPNFYFGGPGTKPEKNSKGGTREINQYGKPERGYGTSLVYYSIYSQSSRKPGITNEVDLHIGKGILAIAGYGWNNYQLVTESGYDRWDALEKYQSEKLSDNRLIKKYAGLGWQPDVDGKGFRPLTVSVVAGKTRTISNLTEAGRGMTFEYGNPWFIEFSFAAHAFFLKK